MSICPQIRPSQRKALSLLGLYSVTCVLPNALFIWAASNEFAPAAIAQPLTEPTDSPPTPSSTPAAHDLLEQARQRLLQQENQSISGGETTTPQPFSLEDDTFNAYRLGPGDTLFFTVPQFPELSFNATLDLQGNVVAPLVGAVALKGLTIDQARQLLETEYNRFVVNPKVDATLVTQRPVQVTILGEVVRPGVYPLASPQLEVALGAAGGVSRLGDLRTVRIRRTLADGSVLERNIDLFTPLKNLGSIPDIRLADGDTLVVPALNPETIAGYDRSLIARSTLAQQQITIRVLNFASGTQTIGQGNSGASINRLALPNGSNFLDALTAINPNPDRADLRHIALIRFDPVQGKAVTQEFNGRAALYGDLAQNPPLEDNDVIVVGRNLINRITVALNNFTQPFRDILGFILFFDSLQRNATNLFRP